jgi:hypothetical protein
MNPTRNSRPGPASLLPTLGKMTPRHKCLNLQGLGRTGTIGNIIGGQPLYVCARAQAHIIHDCTFASQ